MRFIKQTLAIALAILFMLPTRPVVADNDLLPETTAEETIKVETVTETT